MTEFACSMCDEGEILTAKSGWMEEAIGWIDTFEKVTQRKVTGDLVISKRMVQRRPVC